MFSKKADSAGASKGDVELTKEITLLPQELEDGELEAIQGGGALADIQGDMMADMADISSGLNHGTEVPNNEWVYK